MNKTSTIKIILLLVLFQITACKKHDKQQLGLTKNTVTLFDNISEFTNPELIIETDIQQLLENKNLEGNQYQEASLIVQNEHDVLINGAVKIRPRGITRRSKCEFPPIMLKVTKKQQKNLGVGSSGNIKIVTSCKDSVGYDQWLQKEYLCYKFFNIISDHSFKVKPISVIYSDRKGDHESIKYSGFIIEPLSELSQRIDCPVIDDQKVVKNIHKEKYKMLTLFQYMIGNTDWNLSRRHNIRLLECDKKYGPIPIPYDFDYSGLVDASYAHPHPMLPIKNVTERLLQWRGTTDEDFSDVISLFGEKQNELYQFLEETNEFLSPRIKQYLDDFYAVIQSPDALKKEILLARSKN